MVAFALSTLIAVVGVVAVVRYGRRRAVGAPLSWGEAIAASTYGFALMFWSYGVVPHQWLTWAEGDLQWRSDTNLAGPFEVGGEGVLEYVLPFSLNYQVLSHLIAVLIYGAFLTLHVALWAVWQDRAKPKPAAIATSEYGRPLVRQG